MVRRSSYLARAIDKLLRLKIPTRNRPETYQADNNKQPTVLWKLTTRPIIPTPTPQQTDNRTITLPLWRRTPSQRTTKHSGIKFVLLKGVPMTPRQTHLRHKTTRSELFSIGSLYDQHPRPPARRSPKNMLPYWPKTTPSFSPRPAEKCSA
jgi:hypothetical protein